MFARAIAKLPQKLRTTHKGTTNWTLEDLICGNQVLEGTTGIKKTFFETGPHHLVKSNLAREFRFNEFTQRARGHFAHLENPLARFK